MRLRLATRFSAIIVSIFVLALLSNLMALFVAWRVERRLNEIARIDLPSATAADEFRAVLQEEQVAYSSYLLGGSEAQWQAAMKQAEDRLQIATRVMQSTAKIFGWENSGSEGLLARLERTHAKIEAQRSATVALFSQGEREKARSRLLAEANGPLFQEADDLCLRMAAAADAHIRENTDRAARRVHQFAWVIGVSGGLTLGLGGALLWLFFRRILVPLRGLVADAQLFRGTLLGGQDHSEEDEMRTVGAYFRSLMSDVSDTRSSLERSHNRLLVAEKLASVGKLAASVAHEIRNPLTAMKMWLFSMEESARGSPELEHKLKIVSEETTRLDQIVRDFLEFARPPNLQPRPLPIDAVIQQTREFLAASWKERKINLVQGPTAALPLVMADPGQLKQVLINLLNNASDAMTDGGEIRILTSAERDADGRPMVVVRICDAGGGMGPEVQRRVFEPFFSTKEGTGLGLCIAARIMAAHDGLLVLESSSEKGTTFAVWVPIAQEGAHDQDSRSG